MSQNLSDRFHARMLAIHEQAARECNYKATRFLQLVQRIGGVAAAKQLLHGRQHSEGLTRLWQEKRLDISMEAAVLEMPWRALFTEEDLAIARQRLSALGYKFPPGSRSGEDTHD